jgi:hypothetical protein
MRALSTMGSRGDVEPLVGLAVPFTDHPWAADGRSRPSWWRSWTPAHAVGSRAQDDPDPATRARATAVADAIRPEGSDRG